MNGILGMTDLVLASEADARSSVNTWRPARYRPIRCSRILNDVLDFSKIEAGKLDLSPIAFSLRLCATRPSRFSRWPRPKSDCDLGVRYRRRSSGALVGDPDRLQQVLINLIGNAIKFTERAAECLVRQSPEPREDGAVNVQFGVHDTGIGIPADKTQIDFRSLPASRRLHDAPVRGNRAGLGHLLQTSGIDGRAGSGWRANPGKEASSYSRFASVSRPWRKPMRP